MEQASLKHQIKEMENAKREQTQVSPKSDDKLSFDHWWILLNKKRTLRPHLKEIVWADFNARGLGKEEVGARYDEGLKLFGL